MDIDDPIEPLTERDKAIHQIRDALDRLRKLGTIDDIPSLVFQEVWNLKKVERDPETLHILSCTVCDDSAILTVNLFSECVPMVIEYLVRYQHVPLRMRLKDAWDILRGRTYSGEIYIDAPGIQRLRDFLNRVFFWRQRLLAEDEKEARSPGGPSPSSPPGERGGEDDVG